MWLYLFILTWISSVQSAVRHDDHAFPPDDIIELPMGRFPEPDCVYTVHQDTANGKIIDKDVRVGDAVVHSWKCSYGDEHTNLYCLLVNNCTVSNEIGDSKKVPILDEFGCTFFPTVLPHVEYPSDLQGILPVHAFSLDVDKAAVSFECNVKLLLKLNGVCRRPTCPSLEALQRGGRFRRNVPISLLALIK